MEYFGGPSGELIAAMQYLHNPNRASGFAAADGDDTALGQPDRKILVTGSLDAITLRDAANGTFLLNLDTSTKDVRQWSRMPGAIAFTPDSRSPYLDR